MPSEPPYSTILVDSTEVVPQSVRSLLSRDVAFSLVGVAASALEATRLARTQLVDLALIETSLPDPGAIELARFFRLRSPRTSLVFVTSRPTDDELFEAVRVGAAAYVPGNTEPRLFLATIQHAATGQFPIDREVMRHPSVASRILSQFRSEPAVDSVAPPPDVRTLDDRGEARRLAPLFLPLSPREIEILNLVARGNSNKLIAKQLAISDQTVKNHVSTILRKLEVNDRTEAVVYALRHGWIRIENTGSPA